MKVPMMIPGLPSVPTDNYHKFKAVAGIWLIAGSLAAALFVFNDLERESFDLNLQMANADFDLNLLRARIGFARQRPANHLKQRKDIEDRLATVKKSTDEKTKSYLAQFESTLAATHKTRKQ